VEIVFKERRGASLFPGTLRWGFFWGDCGLASLRRNVACMCVGCWVGMRRRVQADLSRRSFSAFLFPTRCFISVWLLFSSFLRFFLSYSFFPSSCVSGMGLVRVMAVSHLAVSRATMTMTTDFFFSSFSSFYFGRPAMALCICYV